MSNKHSKNRNYNKNQEKQCNLKCDLCNFYSRKQDFCEAKNLENCSKTMKTEFAQCDDFLVREDLVMF